LHYYLFAAIRHNDIEMAKYLIENGADVKFDNCYALSIAEEYSKFGNEMLNLLKINMEKK